MNEMDSKFFDEYKRLDKLCSDIFNVHNGGVSEYILEMGNAHLGAYKVSCWNEDYKRLKHLRWVRNQIAHDADVNQICNKEDLKQVQEFHKRILQGEDPLTKLRKYNSKAITTLKAQSRKSNQFKKRSDELANNAVWGAVIVFIAIVIIALFTAK